MADGKKPEDASILPEQPEPIPEEPKLLFSRPVDVVIAPHDANQKIEYKATLHVEEESINLDGGPGTDIWRLKFNDIQEMSLLTETVNLTTVDEKIFLGFPFAEPVARTSVERFAQIVLPKLPESVVISGEYIHKKPRKSPLDQPD